MFYNPSSLFPHSCMKNKLHNFVDQTKKPSCKIVNDMPPHPGEGFLTAGCCQNRHIVLNCNVFNVKNCLLYFCLY